MEYESKAQSTLSILPLDARCALLTNIVWTPNTDGISSLHRQSLWVQFPRKVNTCGLTAFFNESIGIIRVETALDSYGRRFKLLSEEEPADSPHVFSWTSYPIDNIRVFVLEPPNPRFPIGGYYFSKIELHVIGDIDMPAHTDISPSVHLRDASPQVIERFPGFSGIHINERLGLCHERPKTNRLNTEENNDSISYNSSVFKVAFSKKHARIEHLSWDMFGLFRTDNLLSTANTRGAFPIIMKNCTRVSSEACVNGEFIHSGRSITYRSIRIIPQLTCHYDFHIREDGFSVVVSWQCTSSFCSSELAALRFPFDLYMSTVSVLAMPQTIGPYGLISLPMSINAPNYGVMSVSVREHSEGDDTVFSRITPLRSHGELWLDFMPGVKPLENGIFMMTEGRGRVEYDFTLTKVFPFGSKEQHPLKQWWEVPPFYSFVDRDNILGALPNVWLTGLSFRPDLGRFANNSVSDSAAGCASYYADIAAYTPPIADGLHPRDFIKFASEQLLRDAYPNLYSNWHHYPTAACAPIDCAWLYVASSGDWDWAEQHRKAIFYYADVLLSLEHNGTGLVTSDFSGIPEEKGYMSCSWCDSIRSGHLESYVNAHVFRGLLRLADLVERIGDRELANRAREMATRLKSHYVPVFLDCDSMQIAMWVARNGKRYGFHSHFHLGAAIALGLVGDELGRDLLTHYLTRLESLNYDKYHWGLPIFLEPVPAACHNDWMGKGIDPDGSDQSGVYMNGAIHTHQAYYILQALYSVGMRREANKLFAKMTQLMRCGESPAKLHSGYDWRHPSDGGPSGYEGLLAEQYHFLLAAVTGYLGCELTIDGLRIRRRPGCQNLEFPLKPNFARMAEAEASDGDIIGDDLPGS